MEINSSVVFEKNYEAFFNSDKRFIINQGSSRSSKTYSLCQLLIVYAITTPNKTISIVRKALTDARDTVMRDFFEVLKNMELYEQKNHNKSECIYRFPNGTIVEFFGIENEQKIRGRKRNICWVNEGNELFYDDYFQLNLRTTEKMIIDYNPSDAKCWIYDLPEDESIIIKSTYKDNPFLDENTIKQIENLQFTDIELWTIYGLGERTTSRKNIYAGWTFLQEKPEYFTQYIMGLDFGFNHPTALVRIWFHEDELFIEKVIYQSYLTTPELIEKMNDLGVCQNTEIMADWARPEIIQELKLANFNVHNASKSVKKGIDNVKTFKVFTIENDADIKMEFDNYMWKKVGDTITDEPIKLHDDIMDAVRYATYYIKQQYYNNSPMSFF